MRQVKLGHEKIATLLPWFNIVSVREAQIRALSVLEHRTKKGVGSSVIFTF